jgi:hypothetical protein
MGALPPKPPLGEIISPNHHGSFFILLTIQSEGRPNRFNLPRSRTAPLAAEEVNAA